MKKRIIPEGKVLVCSCGKSWEFSREDAEVHVRERRKARDVQRHFLTEVEK